ncbi:MAG TPA: hypothetical protein VGW74_10525, partial [Propionibacteriaceae bacterium]|nr:hypothetical protein [Propionibacteriaceae bacterium]
HYVTSPELRAVADELDVLNSATAPTTGHRWTVTIRCSDRLAHLLRSRRQERHEHPLMGARGQR